MNVSVLWFRRRRQRGVVALLTVAWMMTIGAACWVTLWSIGWSSGQYDTLYSAGQEAAYAAVQTAAPGSGSSTSDQLAFSCQSGEPDSSGVCDGGATFAAAEQVLMTELSPANPGDFGLQYTPDDQGTVFLSNAAGAQANQIYAYEVSESPGAARAANSKCQAPQGATATTPAQLLTCWQVPAAFTDTTIDHYTSGVVLYLHGHLPLCEVKLLCPDTTMQLVVAAAQQNASDPAGYGTNVDPGVGNVTPGQAAAQ